MRPFLRPGLVSVTFRRLVPHEIVALAASCGLEGIEWGGDVHVPDAASAREVRRMTGEAGLAVAAYGSYWRASGEFGPVAETAARLGAPTIRVWAGAEGSGTVGEATEARVVEALRAACESVAEIGTTISLEYHANTLTDTLASTLRLVRKIDHPALRVYWQPFPARSHVERIEEVRVLLPFLSNLHVFQWTHPGSETLRHPLAAGADEWPEVFAVAQGERFALLEFVPGDDPSALPAEAATLRRWLDREVA